MNFMNTTMNPWQRTSCMNTTLGLGFNEDIFNLVLNTCRAGTFHRRKATDRTWVVDYSSEVLYEMCTPEKKAQIY